MNQENTSIQNVSFENGRFRKWMHTDRRVGRPRMNWTEESINEIWDVVKRNSNRFRYAKFDEENQENMALAKAYMGLEKSKTLQELSFDRIFIGSCTNSRIEDLRDAASVIKGQKVSKDITEAIVVPGSGMVKAQAEEEGLDTIFMEAGFLWRDPGCSMCLGMNPDQLKPYERCASTSNRNFEGRQGNLGRTHLMSPLMAALTAVNGKITDPS